MIHIEGTQGTTALHSITLGGDSYLLVDDWYRPGKSTLKAQGTTDGLVIEKIPN